MFIQNVLHVTSYFVQFISDCCEENVKNCDRAEQVYWLPIPADENRDIQLGL